MLCYGLTHCTTRAQRAGWLLLVACIFMVVSASPYVLRHGFAVFYKIHVSLALFTGGLTIIHGFGQASLADTAESIPGTFIWVVDLALRGLTLNRAPLQPLVFATFLPPSLTRHVPGGICMHRWLSRCLRNARAVRACKWGCQ